MNTTLFSRQGLRRGLVLFLSPLTAFFLTQLVYGGELLYPLGVTAANYLC